MLRTAPTAPFVQDGLVGFSGVPPSRGVGAPTDLRRKHPGTCRGRRGWAESGPGDLREPDEAAAHVQRRRQRDEPASRTPRSPALIDAVSAKKT